MYKKKNIAIIIPAYNEEMLIEETLAYIPSYVDKIYVIDDCSTDRTPNMLRSLANANPKLINVRHETNKGVGAAIITGYKRALRDDVDIAAVMAGDNQMDPAYLPDFLDPIINGMADYTKGNRLIAGHSKGMSKWRFLGNSILTLLTKIASGYWQVIDPQNGYTAISSAALRKLDLDSIYPRYGYCNNMLTKMNVHDLKIMNISHPARYGSEKSKIRYGSYIIKVSGLLLSDFLWRLKTKYVITNFHPLVLFYLSGVVLAVIGLIGVAYSLYHKFISAGPFFENGVLSLITFVLGLNFFLFGMVFDRMQDRHHYISNPEILSSEATKHIIGIPVIENENNKIIASDRAASGIGPLSASPVENLSGHQNENL